MWKHNYARVRLAVQPDRKLSSVRRILPQEESREQMWESKLLCKRDFIIRKQKPKIGNAKEKTKKRESKHHISYTIL